MVIIAPDASEMAETTVKADPGGQRRHIHSEGVQPAKAAPATPLDNKIERIQSVLRHFLGENDRSGLGKS
jgi:hypothetical protein